MLPRRKLICSLLLLVFSGCVQNRTGFSEQNPDQDQTDSDNDGVPDSADDFPKNARYSHVVDSESDVVQLPSGQFKLYRFSPDSPSDLHYRAKTKNDSLTDIFVTDQSNFKKYENRSKWSYYEDGSALGTTSAETTFTVGTDRMYYLIIDNTAEGEATPSSSTSGEEITVSIDIELRRLN